MKALLEKISAFLKEFQKLLTKLVIILTKGLGQKVKGWIYCNELKLKPFFVVFEFDLQF